MKFNQKQIEEARKLLARYDEQIEQLYNDYAFELEMKFGLEDGQGNELLDNC